MSNFLPPLLALIPLSLLVPVETLWAFYTDLRNTPTLPPKPPPSQRLRYKIHKLYFNYLVTGPGHVLEPAERACLDCVALALTGALLCCLYVFLPNAVSALQLSNALRWGRKDSFGAGIGLKEDVVMAHMGMNQSLARISESEVAGMLWEKKCCGDATSTVAEK